MTEARELALEIAIMNLMVRHGLHDWTFEWDNAHVRFGCCFYGSQRITISKPIASVNSDEAVMRTTLHEIAHALAGRMHHHDHVWKEICIRIGGDGKRCYDSQSVTTPPRRWIGRCPTCYRTWTRHRRPQRRFHFCIACNPTPLHRTTKQRSIQWSEGQ